MRHACVSVSWAYQVAQTGPCSLSDPRLCHRKQFSEGASYICVARSHPAEPASTSPLDRARE